MGAVTADSADRESHQTWLGRRRAKGSQKPVSHPFNAAIHVMAPQPLASEQHDRTEITSFLSRGITSAAPYPHSMTHFLSEPDESWLHNTRCLFHGGCLPQAMPLMELRLLTVLTLCKQAAGSLGG